MYFIHNIFTVVISDNIHSIWIAKPQKEDKSTFYNFFRRDKIHLLNAYLSSIILCPFFLCYKHYHVRVLFLDVGSIGLLCAVITMCKSRCSVWNGCKIKIDKCPIFAVIIIFHIPICNILYIMRASDTIGHIQNIVFQGGPLCINCNVLANDSACVCVWCNPLILHRRIPSYIIILYIHISQK